MHTITSDNEFDIFMVFLQFCGTDCQVKQTDILQINLCCHTRAI